MHRLFKIIFALILGYSTTTVACDFCDNPILFTIDGALGMGNYSNAVKQDGQTAIGRLSFGFMLNQGNLALGIEAGLQSGNTMALNFPKEDIFLLGGVPLQAELKPLLDGLLTLRFELLEDSIFGILKGGLAYRQMQIEEKAVNDLSGIAAEIQGSLGFKLNEQFSLNLIYQYIFGKAPTLKIDPITETGQLNNIPSQQALMLGVSFNF